ncbi:uncharacterized protein [Musca autumnalis]|uniref:uncharacterized protein n=1 Tax=Musca autumnalis TaxID=221902 RepID=UPI003CF60BCD
MSIFPIKSEEKLRELDNLLAKHADPYIRQMKNLLIVNAERNLHKIPKYYNEFQCGKKGLRHYSNVLSAIIEVISAYNESPDKTLSSAFQRQKKKYFKQNSRSQLKIKQNDENNEQL